MIEYRSSAWEDMAWMAAYGFKRPYLRGIKDGASARQQESGVAVNFRNYYQRCWLADDSRSGAIYDVFPETLDSETFVVTVIEDGITNVIGRTESYGDAFSLCERHDASASSAKADRTR